LSPTLVAANTIRLAIDRTTSTVRAYLLTVENAAGVSATVREIDADGSLTSLQGPSTETTDGRIMRVADLAAAGNVYVAAVAENPVVSADSDKVFLYRYDFDTEEWVFLEGPQFSTAHETAPFVTLVAIGVDDLLVSYRDVSRVMVTYRYDGTLTSLVAPSDTDDLPTGEPAVGQIDAAAVPGGAALLYELEGDDLTTTSLRVAVWTGTAPGTEWPFDPPSVYAGATGNVATGAAAITVDPTISPPSDGVSVAYLDTTGIHVVDDAGTPVADSGTGFSGSVDLAGTSVGVTAQSGLVSIFYLDSAEAAAVVAQYDTTALSWIQFSPPDFTNATPTALSLAAGGGKYFATHIENGLARINAYQ